MMNKILSIAIGLNLLIPTYGLCSPCTCGGLNIALFNATSILQKICIEVSSKFSYLSPKRMVFEIAPGDTKLECIPPSLLPKNYDLSIKAIVIPYNTNQEYTVHYVYNPLHKPLTPAANFVVSDADFPPPYL